MTRSLTFSTAALLIAAALTSACNRQAASNVTNSAQSAELFENKAATQSIMQPKVIAESPPSAAPTPIAVASPSLPHATILFAHGAVLDDAARATLDHFSADPALPPHALLVLRGSTDSTGSDMRNLTISRRRAAAVRAYLATKGITAQRMKVIPLGERRPVAPNAHLDGSDDSEGRARNRRVDIELVIAEASQSPPSPPVQAARPD